MEAVGGQLLDLAASKPHDFARATVVVPTAESGRRLKEYLAEKVRTGEVTNMEGKTALLMPKVVLVGHLIRSEHPCAATAQEEFAAWVEVLSAQPPHEKWQHLFPEQISEKHLFTWALNAASSLASLHSLLEKYEITTQDVIKHLCGGGALPAADLQKWQGVMDNETLRWSEIQQIFDAVESKLSEWGRIPGWKLRAEEVKNPRFLRPEAPLFVACIPEITPQTESYLKAVELRWPGTVTVWVNAPDEEKWRAMFDANHCANPKVALWSVYEPAPGTLCDGQIHVEGSAVKMAQRAVSCAGGVPPDDVVLASCDSSFSPYIETEFKRFGWQLHLPEGRTMMNTEVVNILSQLSDCCAEPNSVSALEPLLRNGVMQRCFAMQEYQSKAGETIKWDSCAFNLVLDKVMKLYFPLHMEYLLNLFDENKDLPALQNPIGELPGTADGQKHSATSEWDVVNLQRERRKRFCYYVKDVCRFVELCRENLPEALHDLCNRIHQRYVVAPVSVAAAEEEDAEAARQSARVAGYASAVNTLKKTLTEFKAFLDNHPMSSQKALALLTFQLAQSGMQVQTLRREQTHTDLLGWRELPYSKGGTIILTGFHHGCVPEALPADPFLPDSVKEALGLPCSKSREARDMFILMSLLGRGGCSVDIILSRLAADGSGSLISPSSLLLHCSEEELVPRVKDKLYREIPVEDDGLDRNRVWRLQEGNATEEGGNAMESIDLLGSGNSNKFRNLEFSPSEINSFLYCPLRFWMKQILGISTWDTYTEDKVELEDNEFGTMVHAVVEDVARRYPRMQEKLTAEEVERYAQECLESRFGARHAQLHLASLEFQRQRIRDLLPGFAQWHFSGLQDGWECYDCEHKVEGWKITLPDGETAKVNMRADRIDRKPAGDGYTWRIIDYKTNKKKPWGAHTCALKPDPAERYAKLMPGFPLLEHDDKTLCWTNIQLPLYAEWLKETMACTAYPAVAYYNMPRDAGEPPVYSEMKEMETINGAWENVMAWVKQAMLCMKNGECLYSAESLGRAMRSSFSDNDNVEDPRDLFGKLKKI